MNGHHLVLGKIKDYLTGEPLDDTLDERYKQKIAKWLVENKKFHQSEITSRHDLLIKAGEKKAIIKVDFYVTLSKKVYMLINYGPGSLVTRRRSSLAISRLISRFQIPVVVVTNGETAEIIDGSTGKVTGNGFDAIPTRDLLLKRFKDYPQEIILKKRAEMESRIVYAYEVDGSCPCDDTICRI